MATDALIERIRRAPSPRIRRQLADAGIDPARFAAGDLSRVAPLDPSSLDLDRLDDPVAELRLADAPPPVRLGTCERAGATIVLTWTGRDLARIAATGAAMLRRAGVAPGMKVANTLEGGFATPGSLALGDAAEALGALDVPLGPAGEENAAAAVLDLLHRIAVDVLVLNAGTAQGLLPLLASRPPRSLRGIVWLGLERPAIELPVPCRRWLSVPEVSVFAAIECERASFHLDPGTLPETIDERLLLTMLAGDAPVLRADAGIPARPLAATCDCGVSGHAFRLPAP
ncbi:MAG: hypothetical protein ACREQY_24240 [Candidatus Binatia bacterium]